MQHPRFDVVVAVLCTSAACTDRGGDAAGSHETATAAGTAIVREVFATSRNELLDIDSPAVWHGPAGEHWLLSTAKDGDVIRIDDATNGAFIAHVGGSGRGIGRLDRPNGIAVLDDIVWIVERDNHRVQLFTLPDFTPIGAFGEAELTTPYGIAVQRAAGGGYITYITDNYMQRGDVPADRLLGRRVQQFRVSIVAARASATHMRAFGDTTGNGALHVVESIAVDADNGRLLIAEEQPGASLIKVYDTSGAFTGETIDTRWFPHEAEGIALYACDDGAGYWIATDQAPDHTTFHVFDRMTLAQRGSFQGVIVRNTDGIAVTQHAMPGFPSGALYAAHDNGSVVAFSWRDIAAALGLREDCGDRAASLRQPPTDAASVVRPSPGPR